MELSGKLEIELSNLKQAVSTFHKALDVTDLRLFDEVTKDLIKNGKIQKFEYCGELSWKVSKMYLQLITGDIEVSPKQVYKTMFVAKLINEDLYQALFKTIEDRNRLSHIYKEEMYDLVYNNLASHLMAFEQLIEVLSDRPTTEE